MELEGATLDKKWAGKDHPNKEAVDKCPTEQSSFLKIHADNWQKGQ